MLVHGKAIEKSPAPFNPGDRVRFRSKEDPRGAYTVEACTESHTKLEGIDKAVFRWQLRRVRKAKK